MATPVRRHKATTTPIANKTAGGSWTARKSAVVASGGYNDYALSDAWVDAMSLQEIAQCAREFQHGARGLVTADVVRLLRCAHIKCR